MNNISQTNLVKDMTEMSSLILVSEIKHPKVVFKPIETKVGV